MDFLVGRERFTVVKNFCLLLICALSVTAARNVSAASSSAAPSVEAFRDSVDAPPAGWKGPRFKLSRDYPKQMPACEAPWLKRPVSFSDANSTWSDGRGYVQDIVDYVKHGQDPNLPDETGWQTMVDGRPMWFHVPWMAYDGQRGREFAHGLTNELSTALSTFHEGRGSGKERLFRALLSTGRDIDPLFETGPSGCTILAAHGCWARCFPPWAFLPFIPITGGPWRAGSRLRKSRW